MSLTTSDQVRRVRGLGYFIAALIVTIPVFEIPFAALPMRLHEPPWRLGFINAMAGAVGLPLLALFLTLVIATVVADRLVLWLLFGLSALAAAAYFLGAAAFVLDAVQMRHQVRADLANRYWIASGWALLKICACVGAFTVLAVHAARTALTTARDRPRRSRAERPESTPGSATLIRAHGARTPVGGTAAKADVEQV